MSLLASDNKAIILAMGHARDNGYIEGLEDSDKVIDEVVAGGADGILTTFGVIKRYRDKLIGRIPTILRLDGGPSLYNQDWLAYTEWSLLHTIEDALFLGVDFEHGADYIKSYYTGTPEGFRQVVNNCPAGVLIAGGPKVDTNCANLRDN